LFLGILFFKNCIWENLALEILIQKKIIEPNWDHPYNGAGSRLEMSLLAKKGSVFSWEFNLMD